MEKNNIIEIVKKNIENFKILTKEIDERYQHMSDMKKLGKNVDNVMMAEIKERIQDMKNLEKMIEEYDKEHNINK